MYQTLISTIDMADVRRRYQAGRQTKQWCFLATAETFEATRRLIGDEGTLVAMLENPEWIRDVTQTFTDAMVLSTNNRERIAAEVRGKLAAGKSCRRYLYHSDHSVPPQVSWATYQYLIELLDRYGRAACQHGTILPGDLIQCWRDVYRVDRADVHAGGEASGGGGPYGAWQQRNTRWGLVDLSITE